MGRIVSELVGGEVIITKYKSSRFIIPEEISQEKIKVINDSILNSLDEDSNSVFTDDNTAVFRRDFIYKLLSINDECIKRFEVYGKGLYSYDDLNKGITWSEVAYLLHYVAGLDKSINWNTINPVKYKVCVLHEVTNGSKILNHKISMYKNRLDMEGYIKSMVTGKRYIPLPLYCSFIDLCYNSKYKEDFGLNEDMLFKKVSISDLNKIFGG